jgi:hypothetical protein
VSTTTTHLAVSHAYLFKRGDVLKISDVSARVTRVSSTVLTVRRVHRWPLVEALRSAWERFIAWPVRDWIES